MVDVHLSSYHSSHKFFPQLSNHKILIKSFKHLNFGLNVFKLQYMVVYEFLMSANNKNIENKEI